LHHLRRARAVTGCDYVLAVMSGNFTQRGEPAIVDKFARARMALVCGADAVVELPMLTAISSAEGFAAGAVAALAALGAGSVCFGAENADISALSAAAEALLRLDQAPEYKARLRGYLKSGLAFPAARARAVRDQGPGPGAELLGLPNNILAIEYLKAILRGGAKIQPFAIPREGAGYHDTDPALQNPSAAAIRAAVFERGWKAARGLMPPEAFEILADQARRGFCPVSLDDFSDIFHYNVRRGPGWLADIAGAGEGIENRLIRAESLAWPVSGVLDALKTKRYTRAALRRLALCVVLGVTKDEARAAASPAYLRVLGFRRAAAPLISRIAEHASVPVVTNIKNAPDAVTARLIADSRRDDAYYLPQARRGAAYPIGHNLSAPMVIIQ